MQSRTTVLNLDSLDDRREIHELLRKLPPRARIAWVAWACSQSRLPKTDARPVVARKTRRLAELARWDSSADERLTLECYTDVWFLAMSYGLDLDAALAKLVAVVRKS